MASAADKRRKRPRDDGTQKDWDPAAHRAGADEQREAKRHRFGTFTLGLGAFAGLVGKAFKATASVFGCGGGPRQPSISSNSNGRLTKARGTIKGRGSTVKNRPHYRHGRVGGTKPDTAVSSATTHSCPPRVDDSKVSPEKGASVGSYLGSAEGMNAAEKVTKAQQLSKPQQHQHLQRRRREEDRLQFGLPNLDSDALRHGLGFLRSTDLAHFARASSAARDIVSGHAALVISERYADLKLGVRDQQPQGSPRRLAFGTGAGTPPPVAPNGAQGGGLDIGGGGSASASSGWIAQQAGAGAGEGNGHTNAHGLGAAPTGAALHAPSSTHGSDASASSNLESAGGNSPNPHRDLWDREVMVGHAGSSGGRVVRSPPAAGEGVFAQWLRDQRARRRDRYSRAGGGHGADFARWGGRNIDLALPALHHLEGCGELLVRQLKTLPRLDLFRTLQSRAVLGPSQYLTAHMRAVLVDWCVEVAFQFRLSTISLHAAVSALDVCLSKVAVPRCRLQLLGVVCAMIQSQAGGGCQVMSTAEAIHICDSQYNPSQVHSTFNIVVSNTQEATARTVPATAAEILHKHLGSMGETSGLEHPLSVDWEKHSNVQEEYVLAGLLIDLSLLDQYMFKFRPGTLAAAALFLARVTAIYYSREEIWVTPYAVVEKSNREVLRLYGKGVCRPFVRMNKDFERRPFGAPGLGEFVASEPREAAAVRKCVERLWLVQQDFFKHVSGVQSPQPVLFRYQHMFKGIKDKFVPAGSKRLQAYQRLGLVQRSELDRMLDKHLPSSAVPVFHRMHAAPPAAPQHHQAAGASASASASASTGGPAATGEWAQQSHG